MFRKEHFGNFVLVFRAEHLQASFVLPLPISQPQKPQLTRGHHSAATLRRALASE